MNTIDLVIEDGLVRAIYSDELTGLLAMGDAETSRASHVEPEGNQWVADMSPSGGPKLPPKETRAEALAAEVEWLKANRNL